jgi:predicted Zn-dependent protease
MKTALLFLLCAVSIPAQSSRLPQTDSLSFKSQRAKQLMAEGKFLQAVSLYRELNRAVPNNPGLMLNLGMALHMAGKKREAIPELEAAVKFDPGLAPAWLFLGAAHLQLGETTAAVKALKVVLDLQPDHREARQMLAGALLSLDRVEEAVEQHERLTALDPGSQQAWYGLGRSYEALSGRAFDELQKTAPPSSYSLALLAETRLREQQFSSAFYLYRRALEEKPTLRGLHKAVAEIYRQTGHPDWADSEENKELQLPSPDCRTQTLECRFRARHYNELIAAAKAAKTADSFYWRSRAYNELALDAFTRLGQLPPSAELHELKARIYNSQKRYSEAAGEWREAQKLSTADAQIQKQLAISLKLSQDYGAALPLLQGLLQQQPASAELNYLVGDTLLDQQRVEEALPLLKRAVSRDPKFLAAHKSLARADLAAGKASEAIPHLKAALPTDDDGSLHYQLAQAYQASGQPELAKKILVDYQMIQRAAAVEREATKRATEITPP